MSLSLLARESTARINCSLLLSSSNLLVWTIFSKQPSTWFSRFSTWLLNCSLQGLLLTVINGVTNSPIDSSIIPSCLSTLSNIDLCSSSLLLALSTYFSRDLIEFRLLSICSWKIAWVSYFNFAILVASWISCNCFPCSWASYNLRWSTVDSALLFSAAIPSRRWLACSSSFWDSVRWFLRFTSSVKGVCVSINNLLISSLFCAN